MCLFYSKISVLSCLLDINRQFGDKGTKNIAYTQEKTHFQRFFFIFTGGWLTTRLPFGYHLDDQDSIKMLLLYDFI